MSEGSWFFDKNFNGVTDTFFDDVVTCLDFPMEDLEKNGEEEDWNAQFQRLDEPCFDVFAIQEQPGGLCRTNQDDIALAPKRRTLPVLRNNVSKRNQLQEASITNSGKAVDGLKDVKDVQMHQTYSPVSVFESSSSCSVENPVFDRIIPQRSRSKRKRQRISNFSRLILPSLVSSLPSYRDSQKLSADKLINPVKRMKRKEISLLSGNKEMKKHVFGDLVVPRKCTHCEVTKTPQWREGPMGPKTLCNACGVRYRSGRLFPEYRPAASPTFIASLHSNCHKKVTQMRSKANQNDATGSLKAS